MKPGLRWDVQSQQDAHTDSLTAPNFGALIQSSCQSERQWPKRFLFPPAISLQAAGTANRSTHLSQVTDQGTRGSENGEI